MTTKRVDVAAGILMNENQCILLAKRAEYQHQGNKWEFPGGKIETDETPQQALCRELLEELGVQVLPEHCQPFQHLHFEYVDKHVSLHFFCVSQFTGTPKGMENQPLLWVPLADIDAYTMPEANQQIIADLKQHLHPH